MNDPAVPGIDGGLCGVPAIHDNPRLATWLLRALLFVWICYAIAFIARTTIRVDGHMSFVLFDDAMVSMRYARNMANGYGLVWNAGQPAVEGFTNPAWTIMMAGIHLLTPSPAAAVLLVQLIGAALLLANIVATWMLARGMLRGWFAPFAATLLTATYYPLNYWGLNGMEVSATALVTTVAVLLLTRGQVTAPLVLLGCATWIRMDMAVPFAAAWIWVMITRPQKGQAMLLLVAAGILLIQTFWRWHYYGDWLPNTYYLKMTGFPTHLRLLRGAALLGYFVLRSLWPLLLAVAAAVLMRKLHFTRPVFSSSTALLAAIIVAYAGYGVYVGGDAWDRVIAANRFVSTIVPCAFVLYVAVLMHVAVVLGQCNCLKFPIAFTIVSLVNFNSFPQRESLAQWTLVAEPPYRQVNEENVQIARELSRQTDKGASVAVDAAGIIPYFLDRPCIDLLGKSDRVIARQSMHRHVLTANPLLEFYPGHLKWDYGYSIGKLKPDVIVSRWGRAEDNVRRYLVDYRNVMIAGVECWFRKDSGLVRPVTFTERKFTHESAD